MNENDERADAIEYISNKMYYLTKKALRDVLRLALNNPECVTENGDGNQINLLKLEMDLVRAIRERIAADLRAPDRKIKET